MRCVYADSNLHIRYYNFDYHPFPRDSFAYEMMRKCATRQRNNCLACRHFFNRGRSAGAFVLLCPLLQRCHHNEGVGVERVFKHIFCMANSLCKCIPILLICQCAWKRRGIQSVWKSYFTTYNATQFIQNFTISKSHFSQNSFFKT